MYAGQIKLILNALLGVVVVLSLMFAPVQASISVASTDMSGVMTGMKSTGCKEQPCLCEKAKSTCDMKLGCEMGCVYLNVSENFSHTETTTYHDDVVFAYDGSSLLPLDVVPLRRPPRV